MTLVFFEALTGDPLGGNRLWIFWKEKTNIQIAYDKFFKLRSIINSTHFIVQVFDDKDSFIWSQYYLSNFSARKIRIGIFAGESVGRGGHLFINNYSIFTSLKNLVSGEEFINYTYPLFLFPQLNKILNKINPKYSIKKYIVVFNASLYNYLIDNFIPKSFNDFNCFSIYRKDFDGENQKILIRRLNLYNECYIIEIGNLDYKSVKIKNILRDTYFKLREDKIISPIPEIIIVGNYSEIPPYEIRVSENTAIYSDYPYADLNDDGYQDLPIRRLCCNLEEINIQVEAKRIANLTRDIFIAHSYYNISEKDAMQGLLNPFRSEILRIKFILEKNNYTIERIGERRLTSKETNEISNFFTELIIKYVLHGHISELDALKMILSFFNLANLFLNLNYEYEINKLKAIEPLNSTNFLKGLNKSSITFLFLTTEKDKYILSSNKTYSEKINASDLPFVQILFDMSENTFLNTFDKTLSFAKITYRNQTPYTKFNEGIYLLASALEYSEPLSTSIMYARNSLKALRDSIIPRTIQLISEDYKIRVADELNNLIYFGENYQLIYTNFSKQYFSTSSFSQQEKISLNLKDLCEITNITINETNFSTFRCNFTNFEILGSEENPKILYYITKRFSLPQFKSLKDVKINYSFLVLNESFNLLNISKFFDIVLVNNTYDIQDVYLIIYPAIERDNKTYLLKDFSIEIYYNDSIELIDAYSRDSKIYVRIHSDILRNFSIEILKENQTIIKDSKNVFGMNEFSYDVDEGKYLVKIKYFEINYQKELNVTKPKIKRTFLETPFYQKIEIFADKFARILKSFFFNEYEIKNSTHSIYIKETPTFKLEIKNSEIILTTPEFVYEKSITSNEEKEKIKTPYGYLEVYLKEDKYYENHFGNYKRLKDSLEKAREMLNNLLNSTLSS